MALVVPSRAGSVAKDIRQEQRARQIREAEYDVGQFTDFDMGAVRVGKSPQFETWLKEREQVMNNYWSEKSQLQKHWRKAESRHHEELQNVQEELERKVDLKHLRKDRSTELEDAEQYVNKKFTGYSEAANRKFTRERGEAFRMLQSKRDEQMRLISSNLKKQSRSSAPPGRW